MHAFDPLTPIEETLRFLDDAVRAGQDPLRRPVNFTGWQLQKTVDIADFRGLTRPVTLQPQYSLLAREIEWEIVPACLSDGLGLLPWSPLGGGWLTGKYPRDAAADRRDPARREPRPRRRGVRPARQSERTWEVIDAVQAIADEPRRVAWRRSRSPGSPTGRR